MTEINNFVETLDGKPILVFGLGKSGLSLVKTLVDAGASVVVGDDNEKSLEAMSRAGFKILENYDCDFSEFAFLLLSPGVPLTHPDPHRVVNHARDAGIEIIGDIELFFRIFSDVKTIGVTGTNGKSTTTSLIHHILIACGQKTSLAGNIGTPIFDLDPRDLDGWVVLEMSSFQIDLSPNFRPDIAVLTNLSPDHIDRHGTMENYMAVKERLLEGKSSSPYNVSVIATDDSYTQKIFENRKESGRLKIIEVSTIKSGSNLVYVEDDVLCYTQGDELHKLGDISKIAGLKGMHNYQNAVCSYAAVRAAGLERDDIWRAIEKFSGLQHRQYLVRTINGVTYVNDSKATNAAATAMALGCSKNVYWIVGGRKKKTGLDGLEDFFSSLKHAFLIGEATEDFAEWLDKYGVEYSRCYDLESAVTQAHKMAQANRGQPGGAGSVLLSPACASFDQFKSFEDRGDKFCQLVEALEGGV